MSTKTKRPTHEKSPASWWTHVWNRCYRGSELVSMECDACGVTPEEWLRVAAITVHVTQEDIRRAKASEDADRAFDPVELALARDAGLEDPLILGYPCSRVVGSDYNYDLPDKAAALVRRFLKGKPVEPIEFRWWPGRGYLGWAVHRVPRGAA